MLLNRLHKVELNSIKVSLTLNFSSLKFQACREGGDQLYTWRWKKDIQCSLRVLEMEISCTVVLEMEASCGISDSLEVLVLDMEMSFRLGYGNQLKSWIWK